MEIASMNTKDRKAALAEACRELAKLSNPNTPPDGWFTRAELCAGTDLSPTQFHNRAKRLKWKCERFGTTFYWRPK
jgi:hypothetical protein